jgi:hypothetical protein
MVAISGNGGAPRDGFGTVPSCLVVVPARRLGLVVIVVVAMSGAAACGGGGDDTAEAAPTTAVAPETTTTTEPPETTTTLSDEQLALQELEGFTSQEQAEFDLFTNPPEIPPALAPLEGVVEPVTDLLVVQAKPDGSPVTDEHGADVLVHVRLDGLGRPMVADDGRFLDDTGTEVPSDGEGYIVLPVELDPAGQPLYQDPPPPPPSTEPGDEPPPRRVRFTRRLVLPANRIVAVGDSVLLGTQATLPAATGRWRTILDSVESRLPGVGDDVIAGHGDLGRTLVLMLGHNVGPGESYRTYLDAMQQTIDGHPIIDRVVWVSAAEIGEPQLAWNEALRAFVAERRAGGDAETHLLDWALYNAAHPEYSDDGLHLTGAGRQALADLIARFAGEAPDCDVIYASTGACV